MEEQERAEQIELAVAGDADALQRLIVEYHAALRAVVGDGMDASARRHFDPDDVLQDAYVASYKAVPGRRFEGPAPFYKWLETIALNSLKNRQRALNTRKRAADREVHGSSAGPDSYPKLIERVAGSGGTPSRVMAKAEATAAVLSSLARLPDQQREVVRLRYLKELPVTVVAERLGKNESAIHGLCYRGLRAMRKSLVSITHYLTRP